MTHGTTKAPDPPRRLRLPGWIERYRELPGSVLYLAAGQFLINLINSAHFFLLNLYLKESGLDDPAIAALGSQRFVAGLFLVIPAGLWLRGRPLRKILVWGSILFPLAARTFQVLRANDFPYWQVFMVTAALYVVGTIAYLSLIRSIERQPADETAKALTQDPGNPSDLG